MSSEIVFFMSVVLITGGLGLAHDVLTSAEIFNPVTNTSCSLPHLPRGNGRDKFSQDGGLACGGGESTQTATESGCVRWSPVSGTWTHSNSLWQMRIDHVSWATASGVWIMGGTYSSSTSEKMKPDGSGQIGPSLKYSTM